MSVPIKKTDSIYDITAGSPPNSNGGFGGFGAGSNDYLPDQHSFLNWSGMRNVPEDIQNGTRNPFIHDIKSVKEIKKDLKSSFY